jgi:hypothetical protein
VVFGLVDEAMEAGVVAALGQFDVEPVEERTLPMPEIEFVRLNGLNIRLFVIQWNRLSLSLNTFGFSCSVSLRRSGFRRQGWAAPPRAWSKGGRRRLGSE